MHAENDCSFHSSRGRNIGGFLLFVLFISVAGHFLGWLGSVMSAMIIGYVIGCNCEMLKASVIRLIIAGLILGIISFFPAGRLNWVYPFEGVLITNVVLFIFFRLGLL